MNNTYAMFTEEGSMRVHKLLMEARRQGWSFEKLDRHLTLLSKVKGFSEAPDTAVREAVYVEYGHEYI